MKTKVILLAILMITGAASGFAKDKTEKFEVNGACSMCENRIEKAALSVDGVKSASWDKKTKMIDVVLDDTKTSIDKVETAIAKVGHDTPLHKAEDKVYEALPSCCHYDRSSTGMNMEMHQH